jgi:N,N-dimethylformamidase
MSGHRTPAIHAAAVCLLVGLALAAPPWTADAQGIKGMQVVGYADRLSVQPGEIIKFMVSSELPRYRADLVRLLHGDPNPLGPGFKEEAIEAPFNKEYPGRHQDLPNGSHVLVPDAPALRLADSFTLQAWIAATLPGKRPQGILTKWSAGDGVGYALGLDADGSLALWIGTKDGQQAKVATGKPLRATVPANAWPGGHQMTNTTSWYFVAATFDRGKVTLYQDPLGAWPLEDTRVVTEKTVPLKAAGQSESPFLIAGFWDWRDATRTVAGGHFNGKIENPHVYGRALNKQEIDGLKQGKTPNTVVAAWDFEADIALRKVTDTGPNKLHGRTVQLPVRAVTGHNWTGRETDYRRAKGEYRAIYFHDDDLDDAGWQSDFEYQVPANLKSGVYAARLRAGNGEDYIPFFVRPKKGTAAARIAFLVPTFSYLAYANSNANVPQLLSLYNYHSDGSGVSYSTRLRPILTIRPKVIPVVAATGLRNPGSAGGFNADLMLADWMEAKKFAYDIITDEDLDAEGASLLSPYKVVVTGAHPEYWSGKMLDDMKAYLDRGGRLMYLGGNGFYWVTSMDPEERHTVEVRRRDGTETWEAAPGEYFHATTGEFGGLWRFRGRPPQQLVGVGFSAQGGGRGAAFRRLPGSFDPRVAFAFEGIGPDELIGNHPSLALEFGAAGHEVDRLDFQLGTPPHTLLLATTLTMNDYYQHVVEEVLQSDSKQAGSVNTYVKGDIVFFEYPNGGAVFSSSSIAWNGSLSHNNYTNAVSKLTENVLRRFASDLPLLAPRPTGPQ